MRSFVRSDESPGHERPDELDRLMSRRLAKLDSRNPNLLSELLRRIRSGIRGQPGKRKDQENAQE